MRRWLGVVLMLAGCVPDGIARATCESEMLATGDPEHCKVYADFVTQKSAIHFDSESRNFVAQVQISLRVAKGTLDVVYRDLEGPHRVTITPQAPFATSMETKLHRETRSFTLDFEPQGRVEGLSGTVDFATR
ncbi:MAG: hypothetical protein QM778_04875 [Myxococcales bacterium]